MKELAFETKLISAGNDENEEVLPVVCDLELFVMGCNIYLSEDFDEIDFSLD